jgi:hypothetical protein
MEAGTAWHRAMAAEKPDEHLPGPPICYRFGKYWFSKDAVEAGWKAIGPGTKEVKVTQDYTIAGQRVRLVGKIDCLYGQTLQDHKCKFGTLDVRGYEPDLQWRFYLWITAARSFRYNLFHFKEPDGGSYCDLKDIKSFRFYSYIDLPVDCQEWLKAFLAWANGHDLLSFLEREGSSPEMP